MTSPNYFERYPKPSIRVAAHPSFRMFSPLELVSKFVKAALAEIGKLTNQVATIYEEKDRKHEKIFQTDKIRFFISVPWRFMVCAGSNSRSNQCQRNRLICIYGERKSRKL
jgi:hypothetical protein